MNKVLFLVIFVLVGLSSKAQSLVRFNCDEIKVINKSLIEKTLFIIKSDTIEKKIMKLKTHYILLEIVIL